MSIITLTTDLGYTDFFVGKLKGILYSRLPNDQVVDISHAIGLHDVSKAAYFVKSIKDSFPTNTIHLVNVYTAYSNTPKMLIYKTSGSYFILPDNGLISLLFDQVEGSAVHLAETNNPSDTWFDTLAHVCACIRNGILEECSSPYSDYSQKMDVQPVTSRQDIRGTIIHVDHMENVVTNVHKSLFEKIRNGRLFEVYFKHNNPITRLSKSYADVPVGEVLCMFNESGMLEIAINMGKASSMLDLYPNETIQIHFLE